MKKLRLQVFWFLLIGSSATAAHWLAAVAAVEVGQQRPAIANVIGWMLGFFISFSGHYTLTFRHQPKTLLTAIWRFGLVSAGGFLANQFAFMSLLNYTPLPYYLLLALILISVAAVSFFFSRSWAFRHTQS